MIRAGKVLSWLLIIFGGMRALVGLVIAFSLEGAELAAATQRYLGSGGAGDAIDEGIYAVAAGIVVGLLARIASNTDVKLREGN